MKKCVLILCTGNSCRSQMAEGLWRHLRGNEWDVFSAGSVPAGYVHPLAVRVMEEIGIDISSHTSKHVDEFAAQDFDLVITVCCSTKDSCPVFPGARQTLHWPFEDPAATAGGSVENLSAFANVRDEIRTHIQRFLGDLPPRSTASSTP